MILTTLPVTLGHATRTAAPSADVGLGTLLVVVATVGLVVVLTRLVHVVASLLTAVLAAAAALGSMLLTVAAFAGLLVLAFGLGAGGGATGLHL